MELVLIVVCVVVVVWFLNKSDFGKELGKNTNKTMNAMATIADESSNNILTHLVVARATTVNEAVTDAGGQKKFEDSIALSNKIIASLTAK